MGVKNVALRDEVYAELVKLKREDESISDVIQRLLERRKTPILAYYGALKGSGAQLDEVLSLIKKARASSRVRV